MLIATARTHGTPPRMWGQRLTAGLMRVQIRNTPTYVGTTCRSKQAQTALPEHPHVCGDNIAGVVRWGCVIGTPPRMWGQHFLLRPRGKDIRNTPTYVGTTTSGATCTRQPTEHPHVCGDNPSFISKLLAVIGTPPRMWGQLHRLFTW